MVNAYSQQLLWWTGRAFESVGDGGIGEMDSHNAVVAVHDVSLSGCTNADS